MEPEAACATPRPAQRQGRCHAPRSRPPEALQSRTVADGSWRESHTQNFPLKWSNLLVAERRPTQFQSLPSPHLRQACTNRQRTRNGPSRTRFPLAPFHHFHHFHHFTSSTRSKPTSRPARRDRLCHSLRPIRREPRIRILYQPGALPISSRWTPQTSRRRRSAASQRRRASCRGCVATPGPQMAVAYIPPTNMMPAAIPSAPRPVDALRPLPLGRHRRRPLCLFPARLLCARLVHRSVHPAQPPPLPSQQMTDCPGVQWPTPWASTCSTCSWPSCSPSSTRPTTLSTTTWRTAPSARCRPSATRSSAPSSAACPSSSSGTRPPAPSSSRSCAAGSRSSTCPSSGPCWSCTGSCCLS